MLVIGFRSYRVLTLVFICSFFCGCADTSSKEEAEVNHNSKEVVDSNSLEVSNIVQNGDDYLKGRDFDGDGLSDEILFFYTGGAHCCYQFSLKLSSHQDTLTYPFEMDGGYEFGNVDGSQPSQFKIDDFDGDGNPEIFMKIGTYNGVESPVDSAWKLAFGVKSNSIIFDYVNGKIVVEDYDEHIY